MRPVARAAGRSLLRRLALGVGVGMAVLWIGAATVAGLVLRREIDEVFDSALQEVAQRVLPLAYAEVLARETNEPQRLPPVGGHREYITYVVRDAAGTVLLQSSDADRVAIPRDLAPGFATSADLRTYTEAAVQGTILVTTAEDLDHRAAAVRGAVMALFWPLVALVPVALAGVWISVRLSLKPMLQFSAAIGERGRGNLSLVSTEGLPDEILPVAASVNALITRLRNALEAERGFTANSAHELRTPIAAALAQSQRLLAELGEEAPRERARAIEQSLRRLSRLSEKLLQLAKAEGGGLVAEHAAPLGPVLRLVVEELDRQLDVSDRLELSLPADGGPPLDLDPDAFAVLARNLVENAVRHGDPEAPITVLLSADRLEVTNGGPPVPADRLATLTQPFQRGPTRVDGSGLGLAIAAAICKGAGLALDLTSPVPGQAGGFRATVHFAPTPP
ncbi:sensor histidine kinase [Prosthecomicrobium sp. N25]|uniref:sensor histidine kinase n=1 Tax=Prosthecomicrobium sp. N25 TaxID=3129254 RepID=UPI00307766EC